MDNVYKKSLALHRKLGGKLGIKNKVGLRSVRELSLAYTPGVAAVSRAIAKNKNAARDYTIKRNSVAVVSDGSAVLGLGNVGPLAAIPVMEGKAALFRKLAGIDAFPICLDTQNPDEVVRTVKNIAPVFGGINLEDISAPRCFEIEQQLREELDIPVVHDDQWASAVVTLAGLINALRLRGLKKEKARVVVSGAGAAGYGIARILAYYGMRDITVCDSKGVISSSRRDLNKYKRELSRLTKKPAGNLASAAREADVLIGVSKGGLFTPALIRMMNRKPVVFALANPMPEIMPSEAKKAGAFIVATGRSDFPNQVNNVLAFPGIFRGALDNHVRQITMPILVRAAENLAACIKRSSLEKILPKALDKRAVFAVTKAIKM